jgi:hypothetical protein
LVGRKRGVKRLLKLRLTQDFRLGNFSYMIKGKNNGILFNRPD